MEYQLKGKAAVVGVVIVLALGALAIAQRGETDDPALEDAIRMELMTRLGARTADDLAGLGDGDVDREAVERLAERSDVDGIEVHLMKVGGTTSGGSAGSSSDVMVYFEYSLPDGPRESEYAVFERGLGGSWRYRRASSRTSWYLNLF